MLNQEIANRFWEKVKKTNGCWNWTASVDKPYGYGKFCIKYKNYKAHRIAYQLTNGYITRDQFVLHKCDNRRCVNPSHLYIGDQTQNMMDMISRNRNPFFLKGFDHPKSRFSRKDILEIREKCRELSQKKVSKIFNCGQQTISKIITGKRYAD